MKRPSNSAYLAIFLTSMASATDPAASATDTAALATDPAASATDTAASATDTAASATDTAASATDPAASATDPAASATDPAASDPAAIAARIRLDDASVLTHVASKMRQRPREKGYIAIPSDRFPSPRSRPDGSSMDGIPAAERPRQTMSLRAEWRGMRPALKRHDKGCVPNASTVVPHLHR